MSPSENINHLNRKVPDTCKVSKCLKQGCRLSLEGLGNLKLLIDLDKPGAPVSKGLPKCDYLLFCSNKKETFCVAPIEMKSGNAKASEMASQLVAGAKIAMKLISKQPDTKFIPVATYGGRLHKIEKRNFSNKTVTFYDKSYKIVLVRCGSKLIDILK